MKKLCIYIIVFSLYFLISSKSVVAHTKPIEVVNEFMKNLLNNKSIDDFVFDGVYIPEIKKDTSLGEYKIIPTPQRKDTFLMVEFYKEEIRDDRVAFIWELVVKNDKISYIETIHNGTNPLLEEGKIVKEYELKFQKNVLVPANFPFEITDFDGYLYNDYLILNYRSEPINGMVKILVFPTKHQLDSFIANQDKFYTLKDGTKVLYRISDSLGYKIVFQKDGLQYNIEIGNKEYLKKKFTVHHLLQIAESMN